MSLAIAPHLQLTCQLGADMVNVIDRRCQEPNCKKFPSHNYPGMHKKLYCATHKREGMVRSRLEGSAMHYWMPHSSHSLLLRVVR